MNKRAPILLIGFTMLLASCGQAGSGSGDPEPRYVEAHDIKQLMLSVVDPQAKVLWNSAGSYSDEKGLHDLRPTTEEGWLAAQSAAATVTQMGNLLQTPQFAKGRGKDWIDFAEGLARMGAEAEKSVIERRSDDAMMEAGGNLYNVCKACHEAYVVDEVPPSTPAQPAGSE